MPRPSSPAKMLAGSAGLVLLAAVTYFALHPPDPGTRADPLAIVVPQGKEARSTALVLTGAEGWSSDLAARAQRLSEMHTLVIGVDGPALLARTGGDCSATSALLARLARRIQDQQGALARTPVLTGFGTGADIALAAADAAPDRFKGLVTSGFTDTSPCGGAALATARKGKAPLRWLDLASPGRTSFATGAAVVAPGPDTSPRRAFYQSYLRLAGTDHAFDVETAAKDSSLADLPLTIHHGDAVTAGGTYAIFLSGDGGWANFDEQIADRLAARGIPVVGISSLRYMWREKRPRQIAADLTRIDRHFRQKFGASRVLLLGFSLGANTLPFAVPELPPGLRSRLAAVGLIAPETLTGFEIVAGGWLGRPTGSAEVAPAINTLSASLPPSRVLCLYGRKETVSTCPVSRLPAPQKMAFDGGHHLGNDYDRIIRALTALAGSSG